MAMSAEDIEAFIAELQRNPQLRDRARNVILADDFLELPKIVARLGERVDQLGERMNQLGERVDQLGERVHQLSLQVSGLTSQVSEIARTLNQLAGKTTNLEGRVHEADFERRVGARVGPRFRRAQPIALYDLEVFDDAVSSGQLTEDEAHDANDLDLVVRAHDRSTPASPEAILAFELSVVVDGNDVLRASRRADILRRCGLNAIAAVGGDSMTAEAAEGAERLGVLPFIRKKLPAA